MQHSNYGGVAKKAIWNEEVGKNPGNLLEQEVLCNSLLLLHIPLSVGLSKGKTVCSRIFAGIFSFSSNFNQIEANPGFAPQVSF